MAMVSTSAVGSQSSQIDWLPQMALNPFTVAELEPQIALEPQMALDPQMALEPQIAFEPQMALEPQITFTPATLATVNTPVLELYVAFGEAAEPEGMVMSL